MTIEAPDAVPATGGPAEPDPPPAGAPGAAPPRPAGARRGPWGRRLWRLGRWGWLLSLVGLNAWWSWREARPLVPPGTIARWIERRQDSQAEPALRRRLDRSPHDGEARILLARLLAQRNELLACARELHRVPFWWPDSARWRLMEAGALKECKRMGDAEAAWKAVALDDPLHPVAPELVTAAVRDLRELYAVEGRWDELVRLIWATYDRTDDPAEHEKLLNLRIRTELTRIAPPVAAEQLEGFLAADPRDWEARRGLARAKLTLNEPAEARRHIEICLQKRPGEPRAWADYLELLQTTGDQEGLRRAVARLPESAAQHPGVLKYRARLLELDHRWSEAAELYRRALQSHPSDRELHYHLAMVEDRLGHREAAQAHRRRWDAMRTARNELNEAYQNVLDLRESRRDSPELHAAIRRLARLCKTLGWERDAEGWARLVPAA